MTVSRALPPEAEWRTHEAIRCLECGAWKRSLGRHLNAAHAMTAAEYRAAWGMRQRQPLSAGYLSELRRDIAVQTGQSASPLTTSVRPPRLKAIM